MTNKQVWLMAMGGGGCTKKIQRPIPSNECKRMKVENHNKCDTFCE